MNSTPNSSARREEKLRELAAIRQQLGAARERRRVAAIEYAATPDGAAETFRRYELAVDAGQRSALREIYLAGLSLAAEEYEKRCELGNASEVDGPLEAIPVGNFDDPVARALIEQRVMGSLRSGPAATVSGKVVVCLLRLLSDGHSRKRLRLVCEAEFGVFASTLATLVGEVWADALMRERIAEFVGGEVVQALAASGAAAGSRA